MAKLEPLDITNPVFKANPYADYARLRAQDPVHRTTFPDGREVWLITRYDDAAAALKDERLVKNAVADNVPLKHSPAGHALGQHMLNLDPPEHTRLRNLVSKAFTPKLVEGLRGRIQAIADGLLDAVIDRGEMDLIDDYAFPLPITVIAEMLGVPVEDQAQIRQWSNSLLSDFPTTESIKRRAPDMMAFGEYLQATIERRRKQPGDDLISALISAEEDAAGKLTRLTQQELLSMLFLLLIAGHETTVNLIGNGVLALLTHPEELAKLKADPSLIKGAVEEFLRYDGPVETATFRFAQGDVTISDTVIPSGATVLVVLDSANRDPALTPQPDKLDITREPTRHLAFGLGVHYCLGAPLARLEAQIAISTLLRRAPSVRLKVPVEQLTYRMSFIVRGLQKMPLAL